MAARKMGTGCLILVHTDNDKLPGLRPTIYALDQLDIGPEWLVARDSLLDPRVYSWVRSNLSLAEKG